MHAVKESKEVVTNIVNEEIMEMIKEERKKRGWSYDELGKRLGVSASYLYRLEKGQRKNPSSTVLKALCELFNIDPSKVLQMEPNPASVSGSTVDMQVLTEVYDAVMKTDVDKTSDVMELLNRIREFQARQ